MKRKSRQVLVLVGGLIMMKGGNFLDFFLPRSTGLYFLSGGEGELWPMQAFSASFFYS